MAISAPSYPNTTAGVISHVGAYADAQDAGKVDKATLTAKGDLFVATASGVITRIPVGTNGQVLTAASGQASGLQWAAAGGGLLVQDEGSAITQRTTLNFVGSGVTVTDDAGNTRTIITIPGGSDTATIVQAPADDVIVSPATTPAGTNGTITGDVTFPAGASGFGNTARFGAGGGRIDFAGVGSALAAFTVECRVKRTRTGVREYFFDQWQTGPSWFSIEVDASNNVGCWLYGNIGGSNQYAYVGSDGAVLTDTNWHELVLVYNGTQAFFKVDGVLHGAAVTMGTPAWGAAALTVGDSFVGDVDECRVSNIARYTTTTHTPATGPFTTDANTLFLAHFETTGTAGGHTLAASDADKFLRATWTAPTTITLPLEPAGFTTGQATNIAQVGVGAVTIAPVPGVTLLSDPDHVGARTLAARGAIVTLIKTATNEYMVVGSLQAV